MFELFQIETDGSPLKRRVSSVEHTAVRAIARLLWVSRTGLGISMPSGGRLVEGDRATEQTTAVPGLLCLPGQERSCGLLPGGPKDRHFLCLSIIPRGAGLAPDIQQPRDRVESLRLSSAQGISLVF